MSPDAMLKEIREVYNLARARRLDSRQRDGAGADVLFQIALGAMPRSNERREMEGLRGMA